MKSKEAELIAKAHRALRSARVLLNDGDLDAAASRTYYSMFYCTEALLLRKGLEFSTHAAVTAAFGKEFAKTKELPAEYHRWLIAAEEWRLKGDYHSDSGLDSPAIEEQIQRAGQFLEAGETYLLEK